MLFSQLSNNQPEYLHENQCEYGNWRVTFEIIISK